MCAARQDPEPLLRLCVHPDHLLHGAWPKSNTLAVPLGFESLAATTPCRVWVWPQPSVQHHKVLAHSISFWRVRGVREPCLHAHAAVHPCTFGKCLAVPAQHQVRECKALCTAPKQMCGHGSCASLLTKSPGAGKLVVEVSPPHGTAGGLCVVG